MSRLLRSSIRGNKSEQVVPRQQRSKRVFSVIPSVSSSSTGTPVSRPTQQRRPSPPDPCRNATSVDCESSNIKDQSNILAKFNNFLDDQKEIHSPVAFDSHTTQCKVNFSAKSATQFAESSPLIVGRANEISRLTSLIQSYIDTKKSASLYVSGAPGTGKTAVVLNVVQNFKTLGRCNTAVINCMQLTSCADIFGRISIVLEAHNGKENNSISDGNSLECFLNQQPQKQTIILVLDEVDQLSTRGQKLLYRIFEWPSKLTCHIIVIGVANALDLPERLLPRLKSKVDKPIHIIFQPYSQSELAEIVQAHLSKSSNSGSCIEPLAIQLCSRKIAASTGDARTALDICRRAIDLAHQDARIKNISDAFIPSKVAADSPITPSIQHISRALKESQVDSPLPVKSFSGVNTFTTNGSELPLHHKLLLASCLLLRKQKGLRELSFSLLYDTYILICKKKQITSLNESELFAVCDLLDSRGFIQLTGPRYSVKATMMVVFNKP
ncbi:unnamed protein product [Schistosoma spindalis]|nr:unnamed protein product [Schistosoma spindale]